MPSATGASRGRRFTVPASGVAAALFKMLSPFGERTWTSAKFLELGEAALAFALLCAGAALLRNALARRFVKRA
jgi:hypothetical protein